MGSAGVEQASEKLDDGELGYNEAQRSGHEGCYGIAASFCCFVNRQELVVLSIAVVNGNSVEDG